MCSCVDRQHDSSVADAPFGVHRPAVNTYYLARQYLLPKLRHLTVDGNPALLRIAVGLPPGADAGIT